MAQIEFTRGIQEEIVPEVRMTRAKSGNNGKAVFFFENPKALSPEYGEEITGMYLVDEEGEMVTRDVKGRFINGKATHLEVTYVWKSPEEFDRFMRFMERYGKENGLGFNKAEE
ncbi:photosystem II reaction center protein Psb28 [Oscillatoriales cyanobacterium LEGE 11467]|uniref:Photosystem II reaction center Psb28 protein n=1 Tax=Zarconia navalis LEGE 11467 TaxID=1828826 RepID=A0A928VYA9_9CYAN|nr:photosystem II reaction center protein Psb28 [Zarconia navalis]MBE9041027.1 photosystem II reaction center protein Psb28 [Zarconia navalis LEGE 11467]